MESSTLIFDGMDEGPEGGNITFTVSNSTLGGESRNGSNRDWSVKHLHTIAKTNCKVSTAAKPSIDAAAPAATAITAAVTLTAVATATATNHDRNSHLSIPNCLHCSAI